MRSQAEQSVRTDDQPMLPLGDVRRAAPTISVVIPVCNGGSSFRQCLASLTAASTKPDEIIVVADGDTDGSWRVAEDFGAQVLRLPATSGPARARNCGARIARGDLLVFLDADVAIHSDVFERIVAAYANEPELAAVFGSYDDAPAETNFLSQYKNLFHHYVHQAAREQASTFWAGCGAIRREVFAAMGGFDERYRRPSIEDIELGYRLVRTNHHIRLCKMLQVKHLKRWTAGSLLKADFAMRAVPWTELILRDRSFINDLNVRRSDRASVVLAYGSVGCFLAAGRWPWLAVVAGLSLLAMLAINAPLLAFFRRKRGTMFLLAAIPWFWLYQLYSGLGFVVGLARHLWRR